MFNLTSFASSEKKANDLNATPSAIIHNTNQAYFIEQMNGEMSNYWKNLGQLGYDHPNLYTLFYHLSNSKSRSQSPNTIHVGLLALPYSKTEYLGWVYWESTPDRGQLNKHGLGIILNPQLSLGIFVKNQFDAFDLKKNLKPIINFDMGESTELASFDFANYDLGTMGRAIGVRTSVNSCGAGGSLCSNEQIRLFSLRDPSIREVLRANIGYFGVYAGEWHQDGTREHFTEELPGVLVIQSEKNKTYPQILIKATFRNQPLQRVFSVKKNQQGLQTYQALTPEIFPLVDQSESFEDLELRLRKGSLKAAAKH